MSDFNTHLEMTLMSLETIQISRYDSTKIEKTFANGKKSHYSFS